MYILGLILFPYRKNHFSEKRWWQELAIEYPSKTRYSTTITSAHAVSQPHILHRRRRIVFALFIAICHQGQHGDSILHTNTTIGLRNRHVSESISNCEMPNSVSGERPKMRAAIERRVKLVSMMMHRGSHAVLLTVVHCYTNNLPFPDIKVGNQYATNLLNHVEMYGLLPYASTLLIILWWM